MFDIPALALVDDTEFWAGVGACIVWAWDGEIGKEKWVIEIGHPVEGKMVGVQGGLLIVVLIVEFLLRDVDEVLEVFLCLVEEIAEVNQ